VIAIAAPVQHQLSAVVATVPKQLLTQLLRLFPANAIVTTASETAQNGLCQSPTETFRGLRDARQLDQPQLAIRPTALVDQAVCWITTCDNDSSVVRFKYNLEMATRNWAIASDA
jgi:hypothetical protein